MSKQNLLETPVTRRSFLHASAIGFLAGYALTPVGRAVAAAVQSAFSPVTRSRRSAAP